MEIKPHVGVGNIFFNQSREQIRQTLSRYEYSPFKRTPDEKVYSDSFDELNMFVYYDKNELCEALEFTNDALLTFEGVNIFELSYQKFEDLVNALDRNLEIEESGFTSYRLGIGVYAPFKEEEEHSKIEGVIVFRKGYYEE